MNINIRGDKIEVTDSIKNYVKEKLERLDKYFEDSSKIDAHVIIRARNGEQIIEVTVPTSKYTLRAEEKHSDLYAAIDLVVDVLERQIRKNKTKLNKRRDAADVVFSFIPEDDEEYVESNTVVKRKTVEKVVTDYDTITFTPVKLTSTDCFATEGRSYILVRGNDTE